MKPPARHQSASTTVCSQPFVPVAEPTKVDSPIAMAITDIPDSGIRRPPTTVGNPTINAPAAMLTAAPALPSDSPRVSGIPMPRATRRPGTTASAAASKRTTSRRIPAAVRAAAWPLAWPLGCFPGCPLVLPPVTSSLLARRRPRALTRTVCARRALPSALWVTCRGGPRGGQMTFVMKPIGTVRGGRHSGQDDGWGPVRAKIELDPDVIGADSTDGLEEFSHVEVVFVFDGVAEEEICTGARHPRGRQDWPSVGILAQRAKNRPNRIGVTICRLIACRPYLLEVEGLDAVDTTPVLDVKPYMQGFAPRSEVREPAWATELMASYW